jgi:hypothetical protein
MVSGSTVRVRQRASYVHAHELDRVRLRRIVLDVVRRDDLERDPQLLEDRAPLRRRRREDDQASPSGNQSAISRSADSGESEP